MKRVLLTGGGGAIGAHVIAHFLDQTDWEIVVLDSFRHKGYKSRIKEVAGDSKRVQVFQHDLVCPISPELQDQIGRIDYILHLAALSDVFFSVENPVYVAKNNIDSMLVMLEYARAVKPEVFLYFSTDEVYGPVLKGDAHEEWSTHRPSNAYAASKAASEDLAYAWWRGYGVPLVITNTMNNFGEMQAPSKFPAMIQKKLEAGEKITIHGSEKEIGTRFYIHSRNTANALLHILRERPATSHTQGEIDEPDRYHIVGDRAVSNLELAQMISGLMGITTEYELVDFHRDNPAHDIHYGLQDNKLRPAWQPLASIEEDMYRTIEWQKAHKEWMQ